MRIILSEKLIEVINKELCKTCFHYKIDKVLNCAKITLNNSIGLDSYILNTSEQLKREISNLFKTMGYTVQWNNDSTAFWLSDNM